ncbi:hypothetical protein EI539_23955, partial [Salmonella enterica]
MSFLCSAQLLAAKHCIDTIVGFTGSTQSNLTVGFEREADASQISVLTDIIYPSSPASGTEPAQNPTY